MKANSKTVDLNENNQHVHCEVTGEMNYAQTGAEYSAIKMNFVYMGKNQLILK